jgi:hypothetical protein
LAFRFLKQAEKIIAIPPPSYSVSGGVIKKPPQSAEYSSVSTAVEQKVVPIHKVSLEEETVTEEGILAEEYLKLHKACESLGVKAMLARMEEIRKRLLASIPENMDPCTEVIFATEEGMVKFSPCGTAVEVTKKSELLNYLVEKGFDVTSLVKLQLTDLKKILSEKELEPFVEKKSGSRIIQAVHQKL